MRIWEIREILKIWKYWSRYHIFIHSFISLSNPWLNFIPIVLWYTDIGKVIRRQCHNNICKDCLFVPALWEVPGFVLFYHCSETDYSWWQISDDRFVRKLKCPGVDIKGLSEGSPLLTSERRKLAMIYNFNWTLSWQADHLPIVISRKNNMKGNKICYMSCLVA